VNSLIFQKSKLKPIARLDRVTCNTSYILVKNMSCKLKLVSRYMSYLNSNFTFKHPVRQVFVSDFNFKLTSHFLIVLFFIYSIEKYDIKVEYREMIMGNYRQILSLKRLDWCAIAKNLNLIPMLAETIKLINDKFGNFLKPCPLNVSNRKLYVF
jgi:hypothetical protein